MIDWIRKNSSLLELNIGIICISTSGVLGKFITMSSTLIIFYRCFIGFLFMGLICWLLKSNFSINWKRNGVKLVTASLLMGAHWVTYFYALEYTTIAIAMLCIFAHPAMTAVLEPLLTKTSWQLIDIILGLLVLVGVVIMVPPLGGILEGTIVGIGLALFSALVYSLRNIVVRGLTTGIDSSVQMLYQTGIVALLLSPFLLTISSRATRGEWIALIALGIVTSAIGHTLYVRGLGAYRAATVGILSSILPVYGILWGLIFLGEIPSTRTVIGGTLVIGVVLFKSLYNSYSKRASVK